MSKGCTGTIIIRINGDIVVREWPHPMCRCDGSEVEVVDHFTRRCTVCGASVTKPEPWR